MWFRDLYSPVHALASGERRWLAKGEPEPDQIHSIPSEMRQCILVNAGLKTVAPTRKLTPVASDPATMNSQSPTFSKRTISIIAITLLGLMAPSAHSQAAKPCKTNEIFGLKSAEDMIRIDDSRWAIASRLAKAPASPGGFFLVDLEQRTAQVLMPDVSSPAAAAYAGCPGVPSLSELVTHGLDLRRRPDGRAELFAVNHGSRQSIEVFNVRVANDKPELAWEGCVVLPSDVAANAVAALPDGMAVTSFGTSGSQGLADLLEGRPAGFVALWKPQTGWTHVPNSDFGGDNGVASSPDGKTLYINDWNDGSLRVLSVRRVEEPMKIKLGDFHPDNLHWLPDGRLLIAGQVGKPRDIITCADGGNCAVGSMVVVVDATSRRVGLRWLVPSTATFAAASTALLYGSDYWVSSFRGDRIVRLGEAPTY